MSLLLARMGGIQTVTGQNYSGQNGMDKIVYGQNGTGQNGMDKMVWTKRYGQNGSNFWNRLQLK